MRGTLTDVLEEIEDIRTKREECPECGRKFTDRDVLALGDFLARYGLGARKDSGVPENLIRALAADVMAVVGDDQEVLREIHDRWVMTLGAHAVGEA